MVVGALAALVTLSLGAAGWWFFLRPAPATAELPEPLEPPAKLTPPELPTKPTTPTPAPEVDRTDSNKPEDPKAPPASKAGQPNPVAEPKADPKTPKPGPVAKKPVAPAAPADAATYRRALLGRIDTLMNKLESQDDKMELRSARSLRQRTEACTTPAECKECERQLVIIEKRTR
ncbi:MAG: hypothetical protein QM765_38240 [Myxococcales bacterium]